MFAKKFYVLGVVIAVTMFMGLSGAIANECNLFGCLDDCEFTKEFRLQVCWWFQTVGINPYFKLIPGYRLVLEGDEEDDEDGTVNIRAEVTVLWETQWIDLRNTEIGRWVKTRVVEEREFEDDELTEVSRNFFAICKNTNAVYYFGEDVDIYEDGEIVSSEGEWRAGEDGAMPGLIMPGTFLLGAKYFQEVAETAADRGENVAMGLTVETRAGTFNNCVKVVDTNPLEGVCDVDDGDEKIYCPGIGLVKDEELELVDYGFVH
jgi:hypothetical protein